MSRLTFALMGALFLVTTPVWAEEAGELPHSEAPPAVEEVTEPASPPASVADEVNAVHLRPYQAIYKVSLGGSLENSRMQAVEGRYYAGLTMTCAGNATTSRMLTTVTDKEGNKSNITTETSVWEDLDGLSMRFTVNSRQNGRILSEVKGVARLDDVGGAGSASIQQGEDAPRQVQIPAGTLFPAAFSLALTRAAVRGVSKTEATVFDGADTEAGLARMTIDITSPQSITSEVVRAAHIELDKAWPVTVSTQRPGVSPRSESGRLVLLANGIVETMQNQIGSATLDMTLESLEVQPVPVCR